MANRHRRAQGEGLALFDGDERLEGWNARFAEQHALVADLLRPGLHVFELVRELALRGAVAFGPDGARAWQDQRLARHRAPAAPFEERRPDGRRLRLVVQRRVEGGRLWLVADIAATPPALSRASSGG